MMMVITPKNVRARLTLGALLTFAALFLLALLDHIEHKPIVALAVSVAILIAGPVILFFGLRWFWRLFIVAWFK